MKLILNILFVILSSSLFCQEIKGFVVDEEGESLPAVKIKNLSSGQMHRSSVQGIFEVRCKRGDTLQFTFQTCDTLNLLVTEEILGSKKLKVTLNYQTREIGEVEIVRKRMADFDVGFMPAIKGVRLNTGTNAIIELENLSGAKSTGNPRELFAKVPGINIWENDGAGIQMGIGGRGLSPKRTANFNTRQNGYDISADALGYPESYYTPPIEALQSIEIIRGSAALQFGTQFGGLLNFVIKDPVEYTPFEFTTRNTVGSYGYLSTFNRISGTSNRLSYQAYHLYKQGDGFRENSQFQQHQAFAQLGYYLNEDWQIRLEMTHMNYLTQQAGGLSDVLFEEDPRQSIRDRNWFSVDWNLLAVHSDYFISKNTTFNVRAFGMVSNRKTLGFLGKITQSDPGGNREMINSDFRNGGVEARILHKYAFNADSRLNINGALLIGGRYYQGRTVTEQGTATDGTNADFTFKNPDDLENSSFSYPSMNQAFFAENMLFFGKKWRANFGARLENISSSAMGYYKRYLIHPLNYDTLGIYTVRDSNTVERRVPLFGAGISYKIRKQSTLYTNFTQNYRAINFTDIRVNNPNVVIDTNIRDEHGYTFELGLRGLRKDYFIYDLAAFYIYYGDKIGLAPKAGTILKERTNIGDAQNYGLELFTEVDWIKMLRDSSLHSVSTFINTSYINANYISSKEPNFLDKRVEYVSTYILKTGLKYQFKGLSTQIQFSYNSEQFSDASNAVEPSGDAVIGLVPAYYVLDFSIRYEFKKHFRIEAGVNNFTNSKYFTRRATGYPGPGILPSDGINGYFTLQYKFSVK
ncbi:MAG: TonB-dependent receptor [Brumimicrobium sp.]|nr:TonB-dependent receptor [Brumimicrobium sp.]